jgi:hypothetical protein
LFGQVIEIVLHFRIKRYSREPGIKRSDRGAITPLAARFDLALIQFFRKTSVSFEALRENAGHTGRIAGDTRRTMRKRSGNH